MEIESKYKTDESGFTPTIKTPDTEELIKDSAVIGSWLFDNDKSPKTQMVYKKVVTDFFHKFPGLSIKKSTTAHIGAFLKEKDQLGVRSKNLVKSVLSSLFQFCEDIQYIPHNPARAMKRTKMPESFTNKLLERDEINQMLAKERSWRNRLIMKMLYFTGVRVSELCDMKLKHFTKRADGEIQVTILGKGNRIRSIVTPPVLWEEIQDYGYQEFLAPKSPEDYLFRSQKEPYGRLDSASVFDLIKASAKRANLTKSPSPHWFRHTSATHAIENGAPIHVVQSTLGHSSIQTTGKYLNQRPKESSGKYLELESENIRVSKQIDSR